MTHGLETPPYSVGKRLAGGGSSLYLLPGVFLVGSGSRRGEGGYKRCQSHGVREVGTLPSTKYVGSQFGCSDSWLESKALSCVPCFVMEGTQGFGKWPSTWTSGSDVGQVFQVFRLPEGHQTSPHLQSCYGCTLRTTEVRPCFSAPLPLTAAHASRNLTQDTQ